MPANRPILAPLFALLLLAGCTPPSEPSTAKEPSAAKKPAQESNLLQSQTQALEKAKQLEQVVQNAARAPQATIEQQTH